MFTPLSSEQVAQYVERVPMVKGRLDRKASTATSYAWFVWESGHAGPTELVWIPPSRKRLERDGDYVEHWIAAGSIVDDPHARGGGDPQAQSPRRWHAEPSHAAVKN